MNLLREFSLLRLWRCVGVGRRAARPVYSVTVPAPLGDAGAPGRSRPVVVTQHAPLPRVVNG
ncbi:hypothetical protein ACFWZU_05190 [Frateuria sp. GZRR33]|uniref:hypothetical protein n=1 Tax=Frateuria sp. GZRR33 TaxID=3351535 RepID=UPI003EDC26B3